jgi:hypothetical protein
MSVLARLPPVGTEGAAPWPSLGAGLGGDEDAMRRGLVGRRDVATRTHRGSASL